LLREKYFISLSQDNQIKRAKAYFDIFQILYKGSSKEAYPFLTEWLTKSATFLISAYHNLKSRRQLERGLKEISEERDLGQLFNILNSLPSFEEDEDHYQAAILQYKEVTASIKEAQTIFIDQTAFAEKIGKRFAAYLMIGLALFLIMALLILKIGFK